VDAVSPPPYVYAATDERPRGDREVELCKKASRFDWLYYSMPLALTAGTIALDSQVFKPKYDQPGWSYVGAGTVGFAWGWALGSLHMALPKCSPDWVGSAPPEGDVRTSWHLAAAFTLLAAVTAPIVVGTETGPQPPAWDVSQRQARLGFAALGGVAGALFPYLLPPRTWSAARELARIRAEGTPDGRGAFVSYSLRF